MRKRTPRTSPRKTAARHPIGGPHPPDGSLSRAEMGALDALLRTMVLAQRLPRTAAT